MRVVKNIHNNISICLDSKGNEVVAFGKGIGFRKPPYDVPMRQIERSFYNINPIFIDNLSQIPENIIDISTQIVGYANTLLNGECNANIVFTLADHIEFSIKRQKENIYVDLPHLHDTKYMYPEEIKIGEYALKLIKDKLNIQLPKQEAAVITLYIIDYGLVSTQLTDANSMTRIEQCIDVVEGCFNIKVDKESFNYSRFVSHMYFLLDRVANHEEIQTTNNLIFDQLVEEYPKTYECAKQVAERLELKLTDEEILYLILHINRLISREESN
ncbi:MAG: PRD domain-containing protein [Erysipelotrichaceae bacterium]|nr:PRD domain-containing protein [Erysipelotrichaceae bacterium]